MGAEALPKTTISIGTVARIHGPSHLLQGQKHPSPKPRF